MINKSQTRFTSSNSQQNLHRRSGKNPSDMNPSTRMYYCETCRIACGGHATYQAHLNGSKHKKKELVAQNQQSSVNLSSKSGVNILRCELCDITCTSSDAYKAHVDGSKHEKVRV
jgi:zinc finger RNA-binding protein